VYFIGGIYTNNKEDAIGVSRLPRPGNPVILSKYIFPVAGKINGLRWEAGVISPTSFMKL
jgi:hypothetical protein